MSKIATLAVALFAAAPSVLGGKRGLAWPWCKSYTLYMIWSLTYPLLKDNEGKNLNPLSLANGNGNVQWYVYEIHRRDTSLNMCAFQDLQLGDLAPGCYHVSAAHFQCRKPTHIFTISNMNWVGMQRCMDCDSSPISQLATRAAQQGWNTVLSLNEPDINGISASTAANWYIQYINPLQISK
jgi:hypothetical protein